MVIPIRVSEINNIQQVKNWFLNYSIQNDYLNYNDNQNFEQAKREFIKLHLNQLVNFWYQIKYLSESFDINNYPLFSNFTVKYRIQFSNRQNIFEREKRFVSLGSISDWDVSIVEDMSGLFSNKNLFNDNINNWNTSQVTNMRQMFLNVTEFNQPLFSWNVESVTNMKEMFKNATNFNRGISDWNTSQVTDMSHMFENAFRFNKPINTKNMSQYTAWDTSNVIDMSYMFANTENYSTMNFNQNISGWDTSKVTNMEFMFKNCKNFNQDLSQWNTENVTNMYGLFFFCEKFNSNISDWDTSKVTNMTYMFYKCSIFNQDLNWDVSNVELMSAMFWYASQFNGNISNWNVSNVTHMQGLFNSAENFNQDIGNWVITSVINMKYLFAAAKKFNQNINNWDVSNIQNMMYVFGGAEQYNQPLDNWVTSNVTNMSYMFKEAISFNQDITGWDVRNVTNMIQMFKNASSFSYNLSLWELNPNLNMRNIFQNVDDYFEGCYPGGNGLPNTTGNQVHCSCKNNESPLKPLNQNGQCSEIVPTTAPLIRCTEINENNFIGKNQYDLQEGSDGQWTCTDASLEPELCNDHYMSCIDEDGNESSESAVGICNACNINEPTETPLIECSQINNENFISPDSYTCVNYLPGDNYCEIDAMKCMRNGVESEETALDVCDSCGTPKCNEITNDNFKDSDGYYCFDYNDEFYNLNCETGTMICIDENGLESEETAVKVCDGCKLLNCNDIVDSNYNDGFYTCDMLKDDNYTCDYSSVHCKNEDGSDGYVYASQVCNSCNGNDIDDNNEINDNNNLLNCELIDNNLFIDEDNMKCNDFEGYNNYLCNNSRMLCIENGEESYRYATNICNKCLILNCNEINNNNFHDIDNDIDCNEIEESESKDLCVSSYMSCDGGLDWKIAYDVCNVCKTPNPNNQTPTPTDNYWYYQTQTPIPTNDYYYWYNQTETPTPTDNYWSNQTETPIPTNDYYYWYNQTETPTPTDNYWSNQTETPTPTNEQTETPTPTNEQTETPTPTYDFSLYGLNPPDEGDMSNFFSRTIEPSTTTPVPSTTTAVPQITFPSRTTEAPIRTTAAPQISTPIRTTSAPEITNPSTTTPVPEITNPSTTTPVPEITTSVTEIIPIQNDTPDIPPIIDTDDKTKYVSIVDMIYKDGEIGTLGYVLLFIILMIIIAFTLVIRLK